MKPLVFLGPSLPRVCAEALIDAEFLPPAAQGDVLKLLRVGPEIIVIIDGLFGNVPPVWHNEILFAIERGVLVIGAASMGALRAAELDRYGMVGAGCIYAAFRRGWLEDDGEVAVLHAPYEVGASPLTEALVNVRATCRSARRHGVLDEHDADAFIQFARRIHYTERTWSGMLEDERQPLDPGTRLRFSGWLALHRVDQKAKDARAALVKARLLAKAPIRQRRSELLAVAPTSAWRQLLAETGTEDLFDES